MRKVIGIAATTTARLRPAPAPSEGGDSAAAPECRSLVAIEPAAGDERLLPPGRAFAPFIAQLIATERQLPQTRRNRRATPHETIAVYAASVRLPRPDRVRLARRSV